MRLCAHCILGISPLQFMGLKQLSEFQCVVQIEVHPRCPQRELRAFCQQHSIAVVAYASLGCGDLLTHPTVRLIAHEVDRTPAQVRHLCWLSLASSGILRRLTGCKNQWHS